MDAVQVAWTGQRGRAHEAAGTEAEVPWREDGPQIEEPEAWSMEPPSTTSVVLSNIPVHYTRDLVIALLDNLGFANRYDFLYLPIDTSSNDNLGYMVMNFVTAEDGSEFVSLFHGTLAQSRFPGTTTSQLCEVRTAAVQGKQENYDRVRLQNCYGLAASARTAGYDNVAGRHLAAEAAAFAAARERARERAQPRTKSAASDREAQVRQQLEFYLSADNLGRDEYLRSLMDRDGWIELLHLIKFPRLRSLGVSTQMAAATLAGSTGVELSADGRRIRHSNAILREVYQSVPKECPAAASPGLSRMAASRLGTPPRMMAASGLSTGRSTPLSALSSPGPGAMLSSPGPGAMESKVRQIGKDDVYF